ncbi:MAG: hypothetical protein HY537_14140 [Deltaproteobacteria bacterium]|nr:hypothetical protein [Deltaproteobacteria bacterium]
MKTKFKAILPVALLIAACFFLGCSQESGVGVGNGMKPEAGSPAPLPAGSAPFDGMLVYHSPYKYSVRYRKELSLFIRDVDGEKLAEVTIDNSALIKTDEPVSSIVIRVLKPSNYPSFSKAAPFEANFRVLEDYITRKYPRRVYRRVVFRGAQGLAWDEERSTERFKSQTIILTVNLDLISISLDAFARGMGLSWVAPIAETFTYDDNLNQYGEKHE